VPKSTWMCESGLYPSFDWLGFVLPFAHLASFADPRFSHTRDSWLGRGAQRVAKPINTAHSVRKLRFGGGSYSRSSLLVICLGDVMPQAAPGATSEI